MSHQLNCTCSDCAIMREELAKNNSTISVLTERLKACENEVSEIKHDIISELARLQLLKFKTRKENRKARLIQILRERSRGKSCKAIGLDLGISPERVSYLYQTAAALHEAGRL